MPELVIFDCDGVLVDSEPISLAVLLEIISQAGVEMDAVTAYRLFLGRSMATIAQCLNDDFGLVITSGHLAAIRSRLHARLREELRPIPHVAKAIDALSLRRCVASSSQPGRIRLSLEVTGLLERLQPYIYSSTMVKNGKPAPDLFLHAARCMGAQPGECVVIEDSVAGIEAAQRAGMRVLAFIGGSHAAACGLAEQAASLRPDAIFDDMRKLPGLIAGLAAARGR